MSYLAHELAHDLGPQHFPGSTHHGLRREMGLCQVLLQRDPTPDARVTPAHEAHDAVRVERLLVDSRRSGVEATDRQVELPCRQTPIGVTGGRKGP